MNTTPINIVVRPTPNVVTRFRSFERLRYNKLLICVDKDLDAIHHYGPAVVPPTNTTNNN